jgi:hypothetical protein
VHLRLGRTITKTKLPGTVVSIAMSRQIPSSPSWDPSVVVRGKAACSPPEEKKSPVNLGYGLQVVPDLFTIHLFTPSSLPRHPIGVETSRSFDRKGDMKRLDLVDGNTARLGQQYGCQESLL